MSTFAELKNRKTDFDALAKKLTTKRDFSDDRFWYPQRDESGNARGVIRFLAPREGSDLLHVELYSHGFKDINGSFYHNCRTTLNALDGYSNEDCPVCRANQQFFETFGGYDKTPKGQQETRRKYFRRMQRYSNILVLEDAANPENVGKVFLFRYGAQILNLINGAIQPKFETDPQFDPFDMWTGANFDFRITKKDDRANYETSKFMDVGPLGDDAAIEAAWKAQYPLEPFVADKEFKSYEDQLNDWNRVTGGSQPVAEDAAPAETPAETPVASTRAEETASPLPVDATPAATEVPAETPEPAAAGETGGADALPDDAVAFFQGLKK